MGCCIVPSCSKFNKFLSRSYYVTDTMLPAERIIGNKGDVVSVLMAPHYGTLGEMGFKRMSKCVLDEIETSATV